MDDESRKVLFQQTPFWMVIITAVVFVGCIFLVSASLNLEALVQLEQGLSALEELLQELQLSLTLVDKSEPTAVPVQIVLPTPTPLVERD